ncbi:MAG TPA: copper amine oxidase, partial [bacterium]|nr:copper amine oxidase [bacterium]
AFSPTGQQLASIAGVGRDLVSNKRLEIVDLVTGQIADRGQDGQVDSQPVWLPGAGASVLFCRGPEAEQVSNLNDLPGVMVPQQRIYQLDEEGGVKALTSGPASTADYYPTPSPSGEELLFLRLERFDQGSLYLQPLAKPDHAQEILRGLRGSPGYYGNYYPHWISVYWFR